VMGAWSRGHGVGARGWVVGLGRPVGCSGTLGV